MAPCEFEHDIRNPVTLDAKRNFAAVGNSASLHDPGCQRR